MGSENTRKAWISWLAACAFGALTVAGCSDLPQKAKDSNAKDAEQSMDEDQLEGLNRAIFAFNHGLDTVILKPITQGYRFIVPEKGREMVSNFLDNLYSPVVFANSILQVDPQNTFAVFWRFVINSTVGIGGLFDVASEAGLKARPADLGETFAFYGVGPGPYFVIPIIGPSDIRDAVGRLGDAFMNPVNYADNWVWISVWSADAIDQRSRNWNLIQSVYDTSLDPYATFRSGYTQKRAAEIKRGKAARDKALADALCKG